MKRCRAYACRSQPSAARWGLKAVSLTNGGFLCSTPLAPTPARDPCCSCLKRSPAPDLPPLLPRPKIIPLVVLLHALVLLLEGRCQHRRSASRPGGKRRRRGRQPCGDIDSSRRERRTGSRRGQHYVGGVGGRVHLLHHQRRIRAPGALQAAPTDRRLPLFRWRLRGFPPCLSCFDLFVPGKIWPARREDSSARVWVDFDHCAARGIRYATASVRNSEFLHFEIYCCDLAFYFL